MKNISLFLTMLSVFLSLHVSSQIKVSANGNVGINTTLPNYKLDINSMETRFYYSGRNALHINHSGLDPRICSSDKIVFYRTDGSGFANIECQVLSQQADRNLNENIVSLENKGITTIEKLNGVSFSPKNDPQEKIQSGFFAQEVESVIPEAVFTNDSTKIKSLAYSAIIPYLVEAIKEQQILIKILQEKVDLFEHSLVEKGVISSSLIESAQDVKNENAMLGQNVPNPFSKETRIDCFIPRAANSSILYNYGSAGTPIKEYNINGKGKQVVNIDGSSYVPGTYFYTLVIDGKVVDTRKMILTK